MMAPPIAVATDLVFGSLAGIVDSYLFSTIPAPYRTRMRYNLDPEAIKQQAMILRI